MTAAELVQTIYRHGGDVTVDGDALNLPATQPLSADVLNQLRDHKAELLDYLNADAANCIAELDAPSASASEARRREVLAMLAANPRITYAITTDDECASEFTIVTLGIRDKATAELSIPKAKYDGLALLDLIEQHASGTPQ